MKSLIVGCEKTVFEGAVSISRSSSSTERSRTKSPIATPTRGCGCYLRRKDAVRQVLDRKVRRWVDFDERAELGIVWTHDLSNRATELFGVWLTSGCCCRKGLEGRRCSIDLPYPCIRG
jgi:hypothetical protein